MDLCSFDFMIHLAQIVNEYSTLSLLYIACRVLQKLVLDDQLCVVQALA